MAFFWKDGLFEKNATLKIAFIPIFCETSSNAL